MLQLWFRLPLRRLAAITVISAETKRDLLKWVPEIDPSRVHVVPVSVSSLYKRHAQPFNTQCPRILQLGQRITKTVSGFVRHSAGLTATWLLSANFVNVGILKHYVNIQLSTQIVGISDQELVNEYQKADILAFASTFEGFLGCPSLKLRS